MIILLFALALLVMTSAFFSASETALFSLSSMQARTFEKDASRSKQIAAALLKKPRELLVTILMLNVCVNILVQNVAANIFQGDADWMYTVGVPLALTLILGEVIPKTVGLANNQRIAVFVAPFLQMVGFVFTPLRIVLTTVCGFLTRYIFFFLRGEKEISVEALEHALNEVTRNGGMEEEEAELVEGYLELQDSIVQDLMRPREDVLFHDIHDSIEKLTHLIVDQQCSRIPVCDGGLDHVIGVVTSRSFSLSGKIITDTKALKEVMRHPFFVPETTPAMQLLKQFNERRESLAIVVDEYNSVSGIITYEDLIETIIGDIADRRDEVSLYTSSGKDVIIASGKLELDTFEEIFGTVLKSKFRYLTIGGWLTEMFQDIPKRGDHLTAEGFYFSILAADHHRVRKVYIRKLQVGKEKEV